MIDSTNPRILADNIRALSDKQIADAAELVALQGDIEALGSYSLNEVNTGKKWIDNSEIFRKVLHIESLPNSTTGSFDTGISSLKDIISLTGFIPQANNYQGRILPYSNQLVFRYQDNNLLITAATDYSAVGAYLVIEYIKSASPSPNLAPAPDDTRSIEPEVREEEPEAEPIEEPVVEVKKTTRKKTTTTE